MCKVCVCIFVYFLHLNICIAICCGGNAQNGRAALIRAAEKGRTDCTLLLMVGGADKEVQDNVREVDHASFFEVQKLGFIIMTRCYV